jgi:hypothetical protein
MRSEIAYPYYGLGRAIDVVQAIRRAGGNDAMNVEVMRELGVAKTSDRVWAYGIPAAIQFGLVERIGRGDEGRLKLTELAGRIVLPSHPEEERVAKIAACKTPDLYAKLIERFAGHPIPSKEGLKNLLYREFKIVESMAPLAADAFLESIRVADLVTADGGLLTEGPRTAAEEKPKDKPPAAEQEQSDGQKFQTVRVPADFVIYKCKIGKGRVIDIPLPPSFTKAEVKRLTAFLETQVDEEEDSESNKEKG